MNEVNFDNFKREKDEDEKTIDIDFINEEISKIKKSELIDDVKKELIKIVSLSHLQKKEIQLEHDIEKHKIYKESEVHRSLSYLKSLKVYSAFTEHVNELNELRASDINSHNIINVMNRGLKLLDFFDLKKQLIAERSDFDFNELVAECYSSISFLNSYEVDDWDEWYNVKIMKFISKVLSIHHLIMFDDILKKEIYGDRFMEKEQELQKHNEQEEQQ